MRALRDAVGVDPEPLPAPYGSMKGTIEILGDPTLPMEHWEMLED